MVGKRLLLKRSSVDVPYGFIIRHVTFYPPKDGLIDAVKYVQKPIYVLAILSVKSASAADEAGLRAGHQIIGLNGRDANHLTYNDLCKITESGLELEVIVARRMRLNSSIMKSFSEDPLSPSAVANSANGGGAIVTTRRNTDTDNLQGSSSSALVEGHSEVTTLKNCKCARAPAVSSTMLHCPLPNDYCCGGGDAPLECKLHRQNISTRNCEMRHSNSKDFHLNERREMEAKMIAVASSPMAAIHYEHLAHRATATTTTTTPLAHIRSALQISQQSSSAPSSTSSASSAHLQGSEKLMAKMYNETQRCVPLKKCLEEMRNDYNNEQFKCYPTQSKRFDVACTSLNQGKFFRRRVTRQASFLAAVSASHSHQEVRSVSTHDLQSDRNYRTEETVKWRGTGSTTRLTSDYTNATKLNESPVTGLQRFSAHAWKGGEIKNNSNLPRHSTYYIPPENIFRNGIRFHDSISDQELQVVQKFLNIPKISPSNTANMRGQHQCSNAANSTSKRPANTTSNSALRNVCRSSLKIIPIGGSDYGDDLEFAINNSSTKRFAHADRSLNYLHASTSLLPEITVTANRDRNVVRKCLARATSAETFSKDDGLSYLCNNIDNTFDESQCRRRRRPISYVMATCSGFPLSVSDDDSAVNRNASSSSDIKYSTSNKSSNYGNNFQHHNYLLHFEYIKN